VPKGTTLAIIVNGTVAGTAEVGAGASSGEWFARLWPGAVGNGANEVEVATVDGSGPEVRLRLLPRSD
jgi:hypothetical protein